MSRIENMRDQGTKQRNRLSSFDVFQKQNENSEFSEKQKKYSKSCEFHCDHKQKGLIDATLVQA